MATVSEQTECIGTGAPKWKIDNSHFVLLSSFATSFHLFLGSVYAWDKTEKDYVMVSGPFEDPAGPEDSLYGTSVAIDGAGK